MRKPFSNCRFSSFAPLTVVEVSVPAIRVFLYESVALIFFYHFFLAHQKMSDSVIKCRVCFSRVHTFRECPQLKRRPVIRAPVRIKSSVPPGIVSRVLTLQPRVVLKQNCKFCLRTTCNQQSCLVDDVLPVSTIFHFLAVILSNFDTQEKIICNCLCSL